MAAKSTQDSLPRDTGEPSALPVQGRAEGRSSEGRKERTAECALRGKQASEPALRKRNFLPGPNSDTVRPAAETELVPCSLRHPRQDLCGEHPSFPVMQPSLETQAKPERDRAVLIPPKGPWPPAQGLAMRTHCPTGPPSKAYCRGGSSSTSRNQVASLAYRTQNTAASQPRQPGGRGKEDTAGYGSCSPRSLAV
ncbi:hCG1983896, partial [Homo sapiens]|uniref:Putative uncharacterized protein FLJ32790 n=1 Tax=Homo sapiens TaxID=9606 RepID=YP010_HUMAN